MEDTIITRLSKAKNKLPREVKIRCYCIFLLLKLSIFPESFTYIKSVPCSASLRLGMNNVLIQSITAVIQVNSHKTISSTFRPDRNTDLGEI